MASPVQKVEGVEASSDLSNTHQILKDRVHGAICLLCSYVLWSIAGPSYKKLEVYPLVRCSWRVQTSLLVVWPIAAVSLKRMSPTARQSLLSSSSLLAHFGVGCFMLMLFSCFNFAIQGPHATSFLHATFLGQLHPCLMVAWDCLIVAFRRLRQQNRDERVSVEELNIDLPTMAEWVGLLLGVVGALITLFSDQHQSKGDVTPATLAGDLFATACSFFAMGYLKIIAVKLQDVPPPVVQAVASSWMLVLVFMLFTLDPEVHWTTEDASGVLDWPYSPQLFPYLIMVGAGTVLGHVCLTWALQLLPTLAVSLGTTLVPVSQEIAAWAIFHVASPPHLFGYLGSICILVGMVTVITGKSRSQATRLNNREDNVMDSLADDAELKELLLEGGTATTGLEEEH